MRLFLVRHGETDSNLGGLALGRDDVELNATGERQARLVAKALAGEPFAAIYSSPLSRALETARRIAGAQGTEVQIDPGLVEMDIGEADGLAFAEVRKRFPGLLEAWMGADGPKKPMPGGERLIDVQERALRTVRSLAARHERETVCAVTHNFVILSILTSAFGIDLANFRRLRHAVGAVTVVEVLSERMRVHRMNDTCHLAER